MILCLSGRILAVMSKQVVIISAVIAILGIAGLAAFVMVPKTSAPSNSQPTVTNNTASPASQDSTIKGSIQSLLSAGKNVKCEIAMPDSGAKGTTYVSGDKIRNDFTVKVGQTEMMTHMVKEGDYMYMWQDGTSQGTKIKFDMNSPKPSAVSTQEAQAQIANLDKQVDMNCAAWSVDNTKFDIPKNVVFNDMSQMMNSVKSSGAGVPKFDKSICEQIPDATAKAECLKSLGN